MKDTVAEVRVGLKDLAAEELEGWPSLSLSGRVRDLTGLAEGLQVEVIRTLAAWDGIDAWAADGAVTAPAWLRAHTGLTRTEAAAMVHLARFYRAHPSVAAALDGGSILVAHARHLRRAERGREPAFAGCVEGLVEVAQGACQVLCVRGVPVVG